MTVEIKTMDLSFCSDAALNVVNSEAKDYIINREIKHKANAIYDSLISIDDRNRIYNLDNRSNVNIKIKIEIKIIFLLKIFLMINI